MLVAYQVALEVIRKLRPIVEQIQMHDAHLADQLRRAATNTVANSPKASAAKPATSVAHTRTRRGQNALAAARDTVTITYPLDPHFGMTLEVWRKIQERGNAKLIVEASTPVRYRRVVPIEWTDLRPSAPVPRVGRRLVSLESSSLSALAGFVAEKLRAEIAGSESPSTATADSTASSEHPRRAIGRARGSRRADRRGEATRRSAALDGRDGGASDPRRRKR